MTLVCREGLSSLPKHSIQASTPVEIRTERRTRRYVEPLCEAGTLPADCFSIPLGWNVAVAVVGSPGLVRDLYGITISHR